MSREYIRKGEWLQITTPPSLDHQQLFRWLAEQFSFPEKLWRRLNSSSGVQLARKKLLIRLFTEEQVNFEPSWEPIEVIYEDDFLLVVNKQPGVKVHPTENDERDTLVQRIAGYYVMTGQALSVRIVHRLDRDTGGLVVFAKHEFAQLRLDEMMRAKTIVRTYLAVVHGQLNKPSGTIQAAIARDRHRDRYRVTQRGGLPAVTHYRVLASNQHLSLLQLELETGRTHQIRVHLASHGHPLLGDSLYGGTGAGLGRQALHAHQLHFSHPWSGQKVDCLSPLPDDMMNILKQQQMEGFF